MIIDKLLEFSDAQAVTASADSTNSIDTGASSRDLGKNPKHYAVCEITTDFATCTSISALLQDSPDDSTWSTLVTGEVVGVADAVAGKVLLMVPIPEGHARYLQLTYTIVGSNATAGAVNAYITSHPQTA